MHDCASVNSVDAQTVLVLKITVIMVLAAVALHGYRMFIAPFRSLTDSANFWRLRQCLKRCYRHADPCKLSVEYRNQYQLNDVELTYGEILLKSFYHVMTLAKPGPHETFLDLGSGTGKVTCAAAILFDIKKAYGIECQPPLHQFSQTLLHQLQACRPDNTVWQQQLKRIEFIEGDFLKQSIASADIIFINATCFHPETWHALEAQFEQLKPGARIIITTKYLNEPHFFTLHTDVYEMSWGYARVSIFKKCEVACSPISG